MSDPIIRLSHHAEVKLTAWSIATHGREFSGLGLIEKEGNILNVVDVDLLGVGSVSYTEFGFDRQQQLTPDPRRKLWFHRHPLGNGVPGPHNWSGRDNRTAEVEPFGVPAELVAWSCSVVLTPKGWVGRVDFYRPKLHTFHCPVEPSVPSEQVALEAANMIDDNLRRFIDDLLKEFEARQGRYYPIPQEYDDTDFDLREQIEGTGDMYCPECGNPLTGLGTEDVAGIMDVTIFECQDGCGGFFTITDHHSCTELTTHSQTQPPQQPAWKQSSWWGFFKRG